MAFQWPASHAGDWHGRLTWITLAHWSTWSFRFWTRRTCVDGLMGRAWELSGNQWSTCELPLEDKDASCLTNAFSSSQGKPQFIKFLWCAHGSFWLSFFWWIPTPVNSLNPQLLQDSIYRRALDSAGATPALTYWDPLRSVDCTCRSVRKVLIGHFWAYLGDLGGALDGNKNTR